MKKFLPVILSAAIAVAGVIFVISGIQTLMDKDLYDSKVTATVVDMTEEWDNSDPDNSQLITTVYIDYEIDGVKYEHVESPEQSSNMKIGDKVEILYQSKNPSKISAKDITKGAVIFIILGALAAIAGAFSTVRAIAKIR